MLSKWGADMSNKIITISRQFGSGGRSIGKSVAARLGIPCYDQEIIEKIVEESGYAKEYAEEYGEYVPNGSFLGKLFAGRDMNGHSAQDGLYVLQSNIIQQLAEEGPCVIVGRCADYVLRDRAELLRVFIHADMEKRAERIVRLYGERADSPEKRLRDKDKRRAAYYQIYTDMKWGDVRNYHVALDSGALGTDRCVETICSLY